MKNESQTNTNLKSHLSSAWTHSFVLFFFFASAIIINGGLWWALHGACFIPDLIRPCSQGPIDIKIRNHLITNKHGSIWNTGADLGYTGDRFLKQRASKAQASRGVRGHACPGNFWDFNSLKSPFLVFWVTQTGYWLVPFSLDEEWRIFEISTWKITFIKKMYIFYEQIWPISIIRWKPVWIHAWNRSNLFIMQVKAWTFSLRNYFSVF